MKNSLLLFSFLFCFLASSAQEQVLLLGLDGGDLSGVSYNNWSLDFTPETVTNPLIAGINESANVISYPAHIFVHPEWGNFGGFLCLRNIDSELWSQYNFLTFKFLVMTDTIESGDGISTTIKYENSKSGANADFLDEAAVVLEKTYTQGEETEWEEVFIEYPTNVREADYQDICIITKNVSENDNDLEMYHDHFRLTMYDDPWGVGIEELVSENGFSVYSSGDMMNIRLDHTSYVSKVQVFDIKGAMMSNTSLLSMEKNFSLPFDLQAGVYMLRVQTDKEILTRKFVKL